MTSMEFVLTRNCGECVHADKAKLEFVVINMEFVMTVCMLTKTKLETARMQESAQDISDTISP